MKPTLLAPEEVEDFWALNVSVEADFVPDAELARAIAEHRVQRGVSVSSMGTAETYWSPVAATEPVAAVRTRCAVVPPGQQAADTPWEQWADDRDADGILWAPFRRGQILRLAGAMPEARAPVAIAECARILAALDARWHLKLRPRDHAVTVEDALRLVMQRLDELADDRIDKRVLRFEIVRTLVKIAWNRQWVPVDVDAAWWD